MRRAARWRSLVSCVILSATGFVVKRAEFRAEGSFAPRYVVGDRILNEISACEFLDSSLSSLVLVADDGELFEATLTVGKSDVSMDVRSGVSLSHPDMQSVDAEGATVTKDGKLYVSSEKNKQDEGATSKLSVFEVDVATGQATGATSKYEIPTTVSGGVTDDEGFKSLTATNAVPDDEEEYMLTTTEYELSGDPPGTHNVLAWNIESGGGPTHEFMYEATVIETLDRPYGVVEFASLDSTILVLERYYTEHPKHPTVILFEVELVVDNDEHLTHKNQIFEWGNYTFDPTVKGKTREDKEGGNFEALCLLPGTSTLLLVSDNDTGDDQDDSDRPQTKFVLIDLFLEGSSLRPYGSSKGSSSSSSKGVPFVAWLLPLLAVLVLLSLCVFCCRRRRSSKEMHFEDNPLPLSLELKYRDDPDEVEDTTEHNALASAEDESTFI